VDDVEEQDRSEGVQVSSLTRNEDGEEKVVHYYFPVEIVVSQGGGAIDHDKVAEVVLSKLERRLRSR
jgi:hypothetical protein